MTLPETPHFLWITQFPLFTLADEDKAQLARGRWSSSHHPFTAPMYEDLADLKAGKVAGVRGQHYDLVLNGQEIGGGSVRIHDAKLQEYVMKEVLQVSGRLRASRARLTQSIVERRGDGPVLAPAPGAQVWRTPTWRHRSWSVSPVLSGASPTPPGSG